MSISERANNFVRQPTNEQLERSYTDEAYADELMRGMDSQRDAAECGIKAADALADCVRFMNMDTAAQTAFVTTLVHHTHRYTQYELFMALIMPLIREYAKLAPDQYDARNEHVVKVCRAMWDNRHQF